MSSPSPLLEFLKLFLILDRLPQHLIGAYHNFVMLQHNIRKMISIAVLVARVRLFKDGQNFQNKEQLAGFSTQIKNNYHMILCEIGSYFYRF